MTKSKFNTRLHTTITQWMSSDASISRWYIFFNSLKVIKELSKQSIHFNKPMKFPKNRTSRIIILLIWEIQCKNIHHLECIFFNDMTTYLKVNVHSFNFSHPNQHSSFSTRVIRNIKKWSNNSINSITPIISLFRNRYNRLLLDLAKNIRCDPLSIYFSNTMIARHYLR